MASAPGQIELTQEVPASSAGDQTPDAGTGNLVLFPSGGVWYSKSSGGTVAPLGTQGSQGPQGSGSGGGGLLACVQYAPGTLAVYTTMSATPAAVDATNLTISFTAPASGDVLVRLSAVCQVNDSVSSGSSGYWCLLNHSGGAQMGDSVLVAFNGQPFGGTNTMQFDVWPCSCPIKITGLTPGNSYQFDWGWLEANPGSAGFKMFVLGATGVPGTIYASTAVMEVWSA